MNKEHDQIRTFRQEYLDYVEGLRPTSPSLDALSDADRQAAEEWVNSLRAARGIDPSASRPSVADLLSRARASEQLSSEDAAEGIFQTSLMQDTGTRTSVVPDLAALGGGLASRLIVSAGGIRVRVIIEPSGTDIDSAYGHRVPAIAAVFGAFPDTSGVLLMAAGPELVGAIVDRDDVVAAIETPSGEHRPPRIRRPITDPVVACNQFFTETILAFEPFDYRATSQSATPSDVIDSDRVAVAAIEQIVAAGMRARLEAKKIAWSELGAPEANGLSTLLEDAMRSPLGEADYRRRLAELVNAA